MALPYTYNEHNNNDNNNDDNNKNDELLLEAKIEKTEEVKQEKSEKFSDQTESGMLQRAVKELHFGKWEEKENAAMIIKRLASENVKVRKTLGELGVIPPLLSMVDSDVVSRRLLAVQALIHLSDATLM